MNQDMNDKYAAILHAPRPCSTTHAPMSLWDRAAQFAPFAALAGHTEGTHEVARITQERLELSEDAAMEIAGCIQIIQSRLAEQPEVTVTYFVPDPRKEGGAYVTEKGRVKKIDTVWHRLVLVNGKEIAVEDILEISI
ncbi:hypothetical protein RFF05_08375 [Bengtsoniella intestinalis]|uniref:hypothetical protein n=1 Tax=Bengtsoniella intestinalis TaxID=3073143 RepID=UPI00391F6F21